MIDLATVQPLQRVSVQARPAVPAHAATTGADRPAVRVAREVDDPRPGPGRGQRLPARGRVHDAEPPVSPGATVTVKNEDPQAHTVTSDQAGLFDAVVPGGGNVVFTAPTTAGSYTYHCTYHSNMHGTLVVK